MKFNVSVCGKTKTYNLKEKELIQLYADQAMEMCMYSVADGVSEQGPTQEEFVSSIYQDIATGAECELSLDGTVIGFVFPKSVRLMSRVTIEATVKEYWVQI